MLKFLEKVFHDIREGENLEVYLTLLVVLVLLVLDVFSVVSAETVAAGTLATLALLAFSTLGNREQIEQVVDLSTATRAIVEHIDQGKPRADDFLWKEKRFLGSDLAHAKFVGFAGVTLSRSVRDYQDVLEGRLEAGAQVRFIIIDPSGRAPQQATLRGKGGVKDSFYADLAHLTIERICILANLPDSIGTVELGLLPYPPTFGMLLIDPDEPHGRIIVEMYHHRSLAFSPTFELSAKEDERWFKFFYKQFGLLWESCEGRRAAGDKIIGFRQEPQPTDEN